MYPEPVRGIVLTVFVQGFVLSQLLSANTAYPSMAPLEQYLITDRDAEIAMARSAAPKSISDQADVMVLGREGYTTAAKGMNGFLCIVERSWTAASDVADFWNPKVRAPICFNPPAARTFARIYLMKTRLVLAGRSKADIVRAIATAMDNKALPALEPGAMCYMMSKQQYLSDDLMSWHPQVVFFVAGDAMKNWGANLMGAPVMAANDPEERVTVFVVWVGKWSSMTSCTSRSAVARPVCAARSLSFFSVSGVKCTSMPSRYGKTGPGAMGASDGCTGIVKGVPA